MKVILFSKSFSSFPHGTCSLSVSCLYLALDGVYHPFWAAFPNNPTLRKHIAGARALPRTGLSPSMTCCSKQLRHARCAGKVLLETTIRRCNTTETTKAMVKNNVKYKLTTHLRPLALNYSSTGTIDWYNHIKIHT